MTNAFRMLIDHTGSQLVIKRICLVCSLRQLSW